MGSQSGRRKELVAPSRLVDSSKRVRFMRHARAGFDLAYLVRKHGAAYASTPSEANGIRTRRNGRRGTKRNHLSYSGGTVETEVEEEGENNVNVWPALAVSGVRNSPSWNTETSARSAYAGRRRARSRFGPPWRPWWPLIYYK